MERGLEAQGGKVIEWLGTEKDVINKHPALVTHYRRALKGNPVVFVELCAIPLRGTLSPALRREHVVACGSMLTG